MVSNPNHFYYNKHIATGFPIQDDVAKQQFPYRNNNDMNIKGSCPGETTKIFKLYVYFRPSNGWNICWVEAFGEISCTNVHLN